MAKDPRSDPAATTFALERDRGRSGGDRTTQAPTLVLPLEPCTASLAAGGSPKLLDRSSFAFLPAGLPYRLDVDAGITKIAIIGLGRTAIDGLFAEYGEDVDRRVLDDVLAEARIFPRTRWVDELCHRYVFERTVCKKTTSLAARFLEIELLKEAYFLGKEAKDKKTRASVVASGGVAEKVRAYIDSHLFEELSVERLCRVFGTSESTLLRLFRRDVGTTPVEYARARRLDEARMMLETGTYSASEVGGRIGYATLAAFTTAFTKRFGVSPSSVKRSPELVLLPPHGEAPFRRPRAND